MSLQLDAVMTSAYEMVCQVETIVQSLTARNAELESQLAEKVAEVADLSSACEQLQSTAAEDVQATMQQLLAAERRADARLQENYAKAVADLAAAKAECASLQAQLCALQAALDDAKASGAKQQEELRGEAAASAARAAEALRAAKEDGDREWHRLRKEVEKLQAEHASAAAGSSAQVAALQEEKQALLTTLDKERRAHALSNTARNDAGWKTKLMNQKTELERMRAERDRYKKLAGQ